MRHIYTHVSVTTHTHNLLPSSCSASLLIPHPKPVCSASPQPKQARVWTRNWSNKSAVQPTAAAGRRSSGLPERLPPSAARFGPARFPHAVWGSPLTFHPCRREWGRGGGEDHPVGVLGGPLELGQPRGEGLSPEVDVIMVG